MTVVSAKYDEHILVHVVKTKGDDVTVVNKLYSRSLPFSIVYVETANCFSGSEQRRQAFCKNKPKNFRIC